MDSLTQRKANRFRFLHALYEAVHGDTQMEVSMSKIAKDIGLGDEAMKPVVGYLTDEQLIQQRTVRGDIAISHQGVVEVERALSKPEQPTHYFPPVVNFTHVHNMVNSQIQQGGPGSQQSLNISQNDLTAVSAFVRDLLERVEASGLSKDVRDEARAEITSIQAQLGSPKPKHTIIREGLRSIRTILEGSAGEALAGVMLPRLVQLLASIGG